MKATDFLKSAVEQYREEVSGLAVPVEVPELGLSFHVFPPQPEENLYVYSNLDALVHTHIFAIKLICGRAKKPDGTSIFDNNAERDKAETMLMKNAPKSFTQEVADRVQEEILDAYPVTDVKEAGNDSGETLSSDSTLTSQTNVDVQLPT